MTLQHPRSPTLFPQEIIRHKRDGQAHSPEQIQALIQGAVDGSFSPDQLAAWLMAAYLRGLDSAETSALTLAMAASGERLDLSSLPRPWVDKHSTGGVGDKTTLVALPILAACGVTAVKMSGRGLGITGGTIDKLQAIPGFRTDLSPAEMVAQAGRIGIALSGQTPNLAPADKILYALRDATATVDSLPLIVASILSKKIAGGAEVVVLDVKCGRGAFMRSLPEAVALGKALVTVGRESGLRISALVTDMDQPLGAAVGNALEVREAIGALMGGYQDPVARLSVSLIGEALALAGVVSDRSAGEDRAREALTSGAALRKAQEWFAAQGASDALWEDPDAVLPRAPATCRVFAHQEGWMGQIDAGIIGQAVVNLGGGRRRKEDAIDPSVGVVVHVEVGDEIADNEPLATVHARTDAEAEAAARALSEAFSIAPDPVAPRPLVLG